jgi:hypothetical protein
MQAWLETVKPGYGKFAPCFEVVGAEDEADVAGLTPEDWTKLEVALGAAGAKSTQLRNIRGALVPREAPSGSPDASSATILSEGSVCSDGRFVIVERAGVGGMGVVWKAMDTKNSSRVVAIKTAEEPPGTQRAKMVQRMAREADILQQLSSPHILQFIDRDLSVPCLVFEFLDGESLQEMIDRQDPQLKDPQTVLSAAIDITLGLAATHEVTLT